MNANESSGFRMSRDDKSPDEELQEEIKDRRISKLSQRITLVSILIPCLIGVLLLVAYLDIRRKVDKTFDNGTNQVQNLSQNFESKLSSMSLQLAKHEETFAEKILSIEKEAEALSHTVKENQKITGKKASKKELSTTAAKIDKKFDAYNKDLEVVSDEITALGETMKKELADLSININRQKEIVENTLAEVSKLSSGVVLRNDLVLALEKEQKKYHKQLDQTTKRLEDKITSIQKQMGKIDSISKGTGRASTPTKSAPVSPSIPQKTLPESTEKQPKKTDLPMPEPGAILEQDIQ